MFSKVCDSSSPLTTSLHSLLLFREPVQPTDFDLLFSLYEDHRHFVLVQCGVACDLT